MTDDDTKHRLAADFVAGLTDQDFDRMRSALHDDATWSVPGETAISGVAQGADAVVERARTITSRGDVSIDVEQFLYGFENVAVRLHNTGQRGATKLDETVLIVFVLQQNQIATAWNLISDIAALNAFFAAGE